MLIINSIANQVIAQELLGGFLWLRRNDVAKCLHVTRHRQIADVHVSQATVECVNISCFHGYFNEGPSLHCQLDWRYLGNQVHLFVLSQDGSEGWQIQLACQEAVVLTQEIYEDFLFLGICLHKKSFIYSFLDIVTKVFLDIFFLKPQVE